VGERAARTRASEAGASPRELLRLEGVCKAFPGILANDDISLELHAGEVHALLGENGAGKTTLMGVLFGLHRPDAGRILVDGVEVTIRAPHDAIRHGIGFVQQHFSLIPTLTVVDNIVLSEHYGVGNKLTRATCLAALHSLAERYRLSVDHSARVEQLSIGEQQKVEIIKALIGDPGILILDEPVALLSAREVEQLWQLLRRLADEGVGVILIGHKLADVLKIADRITVLRRGRRVATLPAKEASESVLGHLMVGDLRPRLEPQGRLSRDRDALPLLELKHVFVSGSRANRQVRDVSWTVSPGEILGIAGLTGSGQVELLEAVAGVRRVERGTVRLAGEDITTLPVRARQMRGIAYIPADRHRDGFVGALSVTENLALGAIGDPPVSRYGVLRRAAMTARAADSIARFDIRVADPRVAASTLSGGNQQKLILARELTREPSVILCCYPTRGLDFAASAAINEELRRCCQRGAAVVIVSIDLDELVELADRILVMQGGQIRGEIDARLADPAELGIMMGGGATE
jgi:general nucleoside transport system ATP-binding protein